MNQRVWRNFSSFFFSGDNVIFIWGLSGRLKEMSEEREDESEDEDEYEDEAESEISWSAEFMESEIFQSPIDLNIGRMIEKELTPLIWCHYENLPLKLKITNTGKTGDVMLKEWKSIARLNFFQNSYLFQVYSRLLSIFLVFSVILSAKWHDEGPFFTGGPFSSKQIFSQLHLHWGANDMEGSEHSVDGERSKFEKYICNSAWVYLQQT